MSVVIRGMKMPKSCFYCPFRRKINPDDIQCLMTRDVFEETFAGTIESRNRGNCPLIELKPHGRLIDADAFAENLKNVSIRQGYKDTLIGEYLSVDDVIDAIIADLTGKDLCGFELNPTIIPADKEEKV